MKRWTALAVTAVVLFPAAAGTTQSVPPASPYAGQEQRAVKALSPEEVEGYQAGAGMGFAKAAELNHYPGPKHVLELAAELNLGEEQRSRVQLAYDEMHQAAVALGTQLMDAERRLDHLFATAAIDEASLLAATEEIAGLRGRLRFVHLAAHLEMKAVLTPEQVARYDRLRGYGADGGGDHHGGHAHDHGGHGH